MKIDVIFTGGTIGSQVSDGWIAPGEEGPRLLLENYRKAHGDKVDFPEKAPYTCLSENVKAENLNLLLSEVRKSLAEDADGIVVTHGTDTLQYTAAFLALALGKPQKCVCIVSSNYPLDDGRANGNVNFEAAVDMIASGETGVFVPYRNGDGKVNIHLADRLLRHGEFTDDVESLGVPYAQWKDGKVEKGNVSRGVSERFENARLLDKSPVLTVVCRPCDSFNYSLDGISAVLMLPYHSGTLNTENEDFARFCEKCKANNVPVYAVGIPRGTTYASSLLFEKLGIIPLYETPFASAYMNLWTAASCGVEIREFMGRFCR